MAISSKPRKVVKPKSKPDKPMTFQKKLSDTKARMNKIVEGDDARYHLRGLKKLGSKICCILLSILVLTKKSLL